MVNLLFSDVNGDIGIVNKRLWSGLCLLKRSLNFNMQMTISFVAYTI